MTRSAISRLSTSRRASSAAVRPSRRANAMNSSPTNPSRRISVTARPRDARRKTKRSRAELGRGERGVDAVALAGDRADDELEGVARAGAAERRVDDDLATLDRSALVGERPRALDHLEAGP